MKHLLEEADRLNDFLGTKISRGLLSLGALNVALLEFLPGRMRGIQDVSGSRDKPVAHTEFAFGACTRSR